MLYPLQCPAQLVGARCTFCAAADAVELADDIVNVLSSYQLAYSLQIAVAATLEIHILNNTVIGSRNVNPRRTGPLCLIHDMFHDAILFLGFVISC